MNSNKQTTFKEFEELKDFTSVWLMENLGDKKEVKIKVRIFDEKKPNTKAPFEPATTNFNSINQNLNALQFPPLSRK